MIVNFVDNSWEIFYHRAHALLAAQVAIYWHIADNENHLLETITAISHHDDLEREWETEMLTPNGAPLDFKLDQAASVDSRDHHILNALYRSRWVALLTSMHLCTLSQMGSTEPDSETQAFLERQDKQQAEWRESLDISEKQAKANYQLMRWCDRLSLILCQHNLPPAERWLEIIEGPDGQRYDIRQRSSGTIEVKPWPFRVDEFSLHADAYRLEQLKFESSEQLKSCLAETSAQTVTWNFTRNA